jgi:hypothetical protein
MAPSRGAKQHPSIKEHTKEYTMQKGVGRMANPLNLLGVPNRI